MSFIVFSSFPLFASRSLVVLTMREEYCKALERNGMDAISTDSWASTRPAAQVSPFSWEVLR